MFVDEGAESQSVPERRGHVGDGHVPVAVALDPAPLLQRLHGRHPTAGPSSVTVRRCWRLPAGGSVSAGAAVDSPSSVYPPLSLYLSLSLLPLSSL